MASDWMDDDEWKSRWERAGDREKVVASLILGAFFLGIGACALFSRLDMGDSLADPALWGFPLVGLVFLLRAVYIIVKPRIPVKYRKRRIQADPGRRARQAEIRRLRQEGLLVSRPDLARELGVQSPTVRRWCQILGIEPAYHVGRNYYTLEQADLIRRYGTAGITQRREILQGVEDRPLEHILKKARISSKKGKIGALLSEVVGIARKQKRRFLPGSDMVVAVVLLPIGLFLMLLGLSAASEARRIASYPVLVGPGFEAMAPGEHAVIVGVLEGNAVLEYGLVAFVRERWDVQGSVHSERSGSWHELEIHVPGLAVSLDGAIVQTARRDSGVDMEGKRHEVIYQQGSGPRAHEGIREGSLRVIGFKNGDLVTLVGEKDAIGTLIPEILYGGELAQLLSKRRGFARFSTPFGGFFLALVPLAWLAMRLHRRIRAGFGKRGGQADPGRRARQAEIRRLRQEGSLVSQPDLARELGVQSSTVRRWCRMLRLEPAYSSNRNYYTLEQADLIRRYGSAGSAQRHEILRELETGRQSTLND